MEARWRNVPKSALGRRTLGALALTAQTARRLRAAFARNPWTLVTLLSAVASLIRRGLPCRACATVSLVGLTARRRRSICETLGDMLGNWASRLRMI
jgi:hypothetical protein